MSIADEVRAPGGESRGGDPRGGSPAPYGEPGGFDRTPPQDVAAEQSVLGGMLLSKDAVADVVEILRSNDFYRPAHATLFDAIVDLYGRGEPADVITVAAFLQEAGDLARIGGAPYLHTLMSTVPTAANAAYYARIVSERAVLRRLVEAGTRIVQMGYGSAAGQGRDVDDVVDLAQQAIYDVVERRVNEDFAILADLLQPTLDEIESVGAREGMMAGVPTGFGDLDRLLNGLHAGQLVIVAGRPGLGKALALDTPLPTPTGWTTMGAVAAGDLLLGADGRPTRVLATSEVMHGHDCFEVTFSDGSTIVADADHQWVTTARVRLTDVVTAPSAPRAAMSASSAVSTVERVRATTTVTTRQIAATLHHPLDGRANHAVACTRPLALPERTDLPVPPYVLGTYLGRAAGVEVAIPTAYLRASLRQRRELLAGLLDALGPSSRGGVYRVELSCAVLARDVAELAASLGHQSIADEGDGRVLTVHTRTPWRHVVAVRPAPSVPVKCVTVSNVDHLYLAGRAMVPTHNSTVAMDFARSASVRHNMASAIFSLEMSKIEIVTRMLSAEARVPLHVLRSGQLSDDDWTRLARRMGEISEAPIFVDDTPNMTLMEIRAKARRLRQRNDLKLVVVDYLQLMTSPKRVENRQQEVADLSRGLKLLAKEIECPVIAVSQLNRGPEQRTDKRPQLSDLRESGCLVGATRLVRADTNQEVTLAELVATGATDVPLWALDERLKYVPRTMTHAFASGVKPVRRMRLASGRQVDATANHKFLTIDGWTPLSELTAGCRIAVPRHIPAPLRPESWAEDRLVLLAHLLGDGSFVARQPIRYASIDEANLSAVTEAAHTAFGITAVRDEYEAARVTTLRLPAPYRLARGRRNPIAAWLAEFGLFGARSHEKFIPAPVFALPKAEVALFLRHLWATDGAVTVFKNGRGGRIYYGSTSRRLIEDVAALLLRFGISTRLRTVVPQHHRAQYSLDVSGRDEQLRFLREIGVHGARSISCVRLLAALEGVASNTNVDTIPRQIWGRVRGILTDRGLNHRDFQAAMGSQYCGSAFYLSAPSRQRMAQIAAVLDSAELDLYATNDVLWDEVIGIEDLGEQPVYDATVLGLHNFIADGVVAHNSIEQDADVVILLHRDDYYDKESPRAGEADFIVAKHRNGPTDTVTVAAQLHFSRFVDMAIS